MPKKEITFRSGMYWTYWKWANMVNLIEYIENSYMSMYGSISVAIEAFIKDVQCGWASSGGWIDRDEVYDWFNHYRDELTTAVLRHMTGTKYAAARKAVRTGEDSDYADVITDVVIDLVDEFAFAVGSRLARKTKQPYPLALFRFR